MSYLKNNRINFTKICNRTRDISGKLYGSKLYWTLVSFSQTLGWQRKSPNSSCRNLRSQPSIWRNETVLNSDYDCSKCLNGSYYLGSHFFKVFMNNDNNNKYITDNKFIEFFQVLPLVSGGDFRLLGPTLFHFRFARENRKNIKPKHTEPVQCKSTIILNFESIP